MKKVFALSISMLFFISANAQTFYDINTIQTIQITFSQSNWDYMLDTATTGRDGYIMAQSVSINGTVFDSVGVKYKGNSSYNANQIKNPFHIELDTYKNQSYQGYTDIKLSNIAKDPSFLREVLSYKIVRQYMDAPLSNYAVVYVNGTQIGLYSSSESISKKFVDAHFYSSNNAFFKCNPVGGAGPGATNKPNLVYLGADSSLYALSYEMNSTTGWNDLVALCDTLKNNTTNIAKVLDVDRALWMMAFDNTFVNLDSYIGAFAQNYYLYQDNYNRFNPVIWDLNECFGTFSNTGTSTLTSTSAKQQLTHLLHQNDANWPLVQKLLAIPMYKRMYVAHMKTILDENITNNSYYTEAQALQSVINTAVQNDPNKFFTYTQFQTNITSDVISGMTSAPGLTNLMNARKTYLFSQADFTAAQPSISTVSNTPSTPALNSTVAVAATVSNTNTNAVYLGYRFSIDAPFVRILMYDDGAHNDGAAGDGVYGNNLPVNSAFIQYYIYAENNSAGIFSPVRAEHEFYTINATYSTLNAGELVINEFMAVNNAIVQDPSGSFSDWIELYNNTNQYISLSNLFISDDILTPLKWKFPDNTIIAPYSYEVVWADNDTLQSGYHANFKLSALGEDVIISYANGTVLDYISFPLQSANVSYGRCPNATGSFSFQTSPSYLSENCIASANIKESAKELFKVYPVPSSNYINLETTEKITSIEVFSALGACVMKVEGNNNTSETLDISMLGAGVYTLIINKKSGHKIIKQ